ncbi:MAG: serine/threonine protein kinase [Cocleimonas sp.]|nr:serine/threonine protein kinase [Cocleimonas sp.]
MRVNWLKTVLKEDKETLKEVLILLESHNVLDDFLGKPIAATEAVNRMIERCPDLTGRYLGVYQVIKKIAHGGMGRVYSAQRIDGEYEQIVAIKVLEVANLELQLFLRERQLLADIQHPNIVTLLDGGTLTEGFPYLVMELVEGISIDRYAIENSLPVQAIVQLCADLCGVVDDAHQEDIIHCDLKPDNILVINKGNRNGVLKLLDFGIAQTLTENKCLKPNETLPTYAITPEYASPQRHQQGLPDKTDDVFSLGVILGQLLSGEPLPVIQDASVNNPYSSPDLNTLAQRVEDKELEQILTKATAHDRRGRYASAQELQQDLQHWLKGEPIVAAQGGIFYFLGKLLSRYQYFFMTIFVVSLFTLGIGQILGQYRQQSENNGLRQENAVEAVADLKQMLATIPYTPSLEKEVTKLTINRLQDWSHDSPENQAIRVLYAEHLVRMGNISGHAYYLNLNDPIEARYLYKKALSLYQHLADKDAIKGHATVQQSTDINQLFIQHRLLEIDINNARDHASAHQYWQAMQTLQRQLEHHSFASFSRKQQQMILSMLLAEAYESLRLQAYQATPRLLEKAHHLMTISDVAPKRRSEEERYLIAFYYEIKGHLFFLQGELNEAMHTYSKISRPKLKGEPVSGRYRYLLTRVDSVFACIGFTQKNKEMQAQHFKYFEYARLNLATLADQYKDVPMLQKKIIRMNQAKQAGQHALFCKNPAQFLFSS